MKDLHELVNFKSGSPQFRIIESLDKDAPCYRLYSQSDLLSDLTGIYTADVENKEIRTKDTVHTLTAGDIVFSLITGKAALVQPMHEGYLYTQNYIKIIPIVLFDARFFVYLLNEDASVRKQLFLGLQGSQVLKYTLQQLKALQIRRLPALEKQQMIGNVYVKQLRLEALQKRAAELEKVICLAKLAEAGK